MAMIDTPSDSGIILDRRQLISGASALGLSATFGAMPAMAQGAPKKGGVLRLGMEGGGQLQTAWILAPMLTQFQSPTA